MKERGGFFRVYFEKKGGGGQALVINAQSSMSWEGEEANGPEIVHRSRCPPSDLPSDPPSAPPPPTHRDLCALEKHFSEMLNLPEEERRGKLGFFSPDL